MSVEGSKSYPRQSQIEENHLFAEPTEAELNQYIADYQRATKTPVMVAPGPLRPSMDHAFDAILWTVTLQGIRRIVVETEPMTPVMEITGVQVASLRIDAKTLSPTATIELYAKKEIDDGDRESFVFAGPKRELKAAFAYIGFPNIERWTP
jgi:hypothetical protein